LRVNIADNWGSARLTVGEVEFYDAALFLVNDDSQTYQDSGDSNQFQNSTLTQATTGSTIARIQYADYPSDQEWATAADVQSGASWNGTWLTEAQMQAESDSSLRFRYMKIWLATDSDDSYDSLSCDAVTTDLTAPTSTEDAFAVSKPSGGTVDSWWRWTNGTDSGGSGFAGANPAYYDSDDSQWYYRQSDDSWATDETFANLDLLGTEGAEYNAIFENLPTTASQARLTCWDNAGNNSARADFNLDEVGQQAAQASGFNDGFN
jgi:hypothetical protein